MAKRLIRFSKPSGNGGKVDSTRNERSHGPAAVACGCGVRRALAVCAGLARGSSPTRATAEGRPWTLFDAVGAPPSPPGGADGGGGGVKSRTLAVAPQPHAVLRWAPGSPAAPPPRARPQRGAPGPPLGHRERRRPMKRAAPLRRRRLQPRPRALRPAGKTAEPGPN
jgi:hypothetical protein